MKTKTADARKTEAKKALSPATARSAAVASAARLAPDIPVRLGRTPATRFRGDPDIFGRLLEDHDKHRALFAMLRQTAARDPQRARLFEALVLDIKSHAAAEEQALWSTVLRNPQTTDVARHAIAEHKELDALLADLAARDMHGRGWLARLTQVQEEYLHHIREEEQEQFVAAQAQLSAADTRHMRGVFRRRKAAEKAAATITRKRKHDG